MNANKNHLNLIWVGGAIRKTCYIKFDKKMQNYGFSNVV